VPENTIENLIRIALLHISLFENVFILSVLAYLAISILKLHHGFVSQ
jgi:hypothetical protein